MPVFFDANVGADPNSVLDFAELVKLFSRIPARQLIMFIDVCHSGGAAARTDESALDLGPSVGGLFTSRLMEALATTKARAAPTMRTLTTSTAPAKSSKTTCWIVRWFATPRTVSAEPSPIVTRIPWCEGIQIAFNSCPIRTSSRAKTTRLSDRYPLALRNRSALPMTETDDKLIVSAAMSGLNSQPVSGYSTPAASGIPKAL